jgi:hypothetical protein
MRIVVVWPKGTHPELRAELEALSPRFRAERLRTLATIGLFIARGHSPVTGIQPESNEDQSVIVAEERNSPAFSNLMGKLKGSLS